MATKDEIYERKPGKGKVLKEQSQGTE